MPAQCCKEFWNKIEDDVPVFTIVGYDALAITTIEHWLVYAKAAGVNQQKIAKAERHLADIREYQFLNKDKVKIPD